MRLLIVALVLSSCSAPPIMTSVPAPPSGAVNPAPSAPEATSARRNVAITIDDLGVDEASSDPELSSRILAQLADAAAPVAVFVNCEHLKDETLALWRAAGATIGNHTYSHASLDGGADAGFSELWWRDVARCHERLAQSAAGDVRYFRFPYLRYGANEARKREAAQRLASLGYRVAHVTAATSEWLLAQYYELALEAGDGAFARSVAQRYIAHMVETLETAEQLAASKGWRQVKQITLLHVNRLAGDHLAQVLAALRVRGWHFISLEEALSDPVYERNDEYTGGCGCSWLARIAPALSKTDDYAFGEYEARIREQLEPHAATLRSR